MIHIGEIIKSEVESRRFTQKQFGTLINKNEKTVPDIYDRPSVSTDLLLTICEALGKDLFSVYYNEDPLKRLRQDEVSKLKGQIQNLNEEINRLKRELELSQSLADARKETIFILKEHLTQTKIISNIIWP